MTDAAKPMHGIPSTGVAGAHRAADAAPLLPPEAPMAMPVQSFRTGKCVTGPFPSTPKGMVLRRAWILGATAALTLLATAVFYQVLGSGGLTILEALLLVLFIALFAWIAQSFVSACAGFLLSFSKRKPRLQLANDFGPLPTLCERTALLMPTYNEDPQRLMTGLQAIYESVAATGRLAHFDFFILSDTTKPDIQAAELVAFQQLRERTGGHARLFYRRRDDNRERKAGNISEWVRRFGGSYPYMLVLDADSLMTGEVVVRMADAIERHPDVGLIQTLPMIVNGNTLFARMQQFSGRVYGPVVAKGIAWWHGAESNYWGHNAVIRTRAFAEQAGLPELTGLRPFGGHILSHDFVEAALMRRGGWALHMVPGLVGSYEEGPPTLTDMMIRDRRWCQGNLQHSAVLPAKGLHWVSRWHLMIGIGHYFTAPMWAMLMLVGLAIPLTQGESVWQALSLPGFSPTAYWRAQNPHLILWVFVGSMTVLLAPKLMGFVASMFDGPVRRGTGGVLRAFISLLLETVMGALMAPITMYVQSRGVAEVLAGKDSGWESQQRDDGSISWWGIVRAYLGLSLLGAVIGTAAYFVSPSLAAWMSPVILGLVLAIPIVALTSARGPGVLLRKLGLLRIPEEVSPPPVLQRARELRHAAATGAVIPAMDESLRQ